MLQRNARLLALLAAMVIGCGDDDGSGAAPLRILVTNDDGVAAEGIDAVVQALLENSLNLVTVCAPDGNRSGTGDNAGPSELCGDLTVTSTTTASGYPATAINGCPADTVNYALATLYAADAPPHLVISGINAGQNISFPIATRISGTVGAARTAARLGIPALAASQGAPGSGGDYDYPSGAAAVLGWLEEHRSELQDDAAPARVDNINIPSCASGTAIRGTLTGIALAPTANGIFSAQNCSSTLESPKDDVEALLNGYVTLSDVPFDD